MSALPPADDDGAPVSGELVSFEFDPPAVSPLTRTRVYVACLILDVLAVLGFGLAAIFDWLPSGQAAAALTLVLAAINGLGTGLGVAYRPTRPGAVR